jgi:hypothetical protein
MSAPTLPGWLIAEDTAGERQFMVHTAPPRFIAEICDHAQLAPFVYSLATGQELAWFAWIDHPPTDEALNELLAQAELAITVYDAQLGLDDDPT